MVEKVDLAAIAIKGRQRARRSRKKRKKPYEKETRSPEKKYIKEEREKKTSG